MQWASWNFPTWPIALGLLCFNLRRDILQKNYCQKANKNYLSHCRCQLIVIFSLFFRCKNRQKKHFTKIYSTSSLIYSMKSKFKYRMAQIIPYGR